ncbi:MAG: pyruvate flavodoxin/ferredoxin oxidoreductase, partial [Gemmatimonadota bacterium]
MREFLDGGEVIARAAIHAGCDFFAGYPITPSTSILTHLLRELPKVGGVGVHAEDEIAAMGFCIGAALAGRRVMTATSGPGISLFSENIGLAIMGEVPMVIVDAQRMGPATGSATAVAQGDIQFLRWCTSGGFPVIVLAPVDLPDAYALTLRAFDLAERFRSPVFLATDKDTVMGKATVDSRSLEPASVRPRTLAPADEPFVPYRVERPEQVPPMAHFGGPHVVRFTTSSHDEAGYQAKWPEQISALSQHLMEKVNAHTSEISQVRWDREPGARTLILSYGVTALAAREAVVRGRVRGLALSSLEVLSLWPVPDLALIEAMEDAQRVVVAELNFGQYRREVERVAGVAFRGRTGPEVMGVCRMDGELIDPEEIL